MVTFTTLGYGDVLLNERWRILGSFEAANGIIMFGWTTAIIIISIRTGCRAFIGKLSSNADDVDMLSSSGLC